MTVSLRRRDRRLAGRELERERICEAMVALVTEQGFEAIDVELVCDRAGVDRAAFESHFESVQQCLDQLWEEMTSEYTEGLIAAYAGGAPWRDRLRRSAYYTLRYFREDDVRTKFFMVGTLSAGELAKARRDRMIQLGIDLVDGARAELENPEAVSRSEAEAVTGAIYDSMVSAVLSGKIEAFEGLVPQLMYLAVLSYFGHDEAAAELRRGADDLERYRRGEL